MKNNCKLFLVICQESLAQDLGAWACLRKLQWGAVWDGGLGCVGQGILKSAVLVPFKGLRVLLVNSDLGPKFEGGAEKQKEPLAWIQNRTS
jgi:hypothetical protein